MADKNQKVILYIGGGVMAGVFSAGVVKTLEENNFYDKLEAVYASSAGVLVASYFLANQVEIGASIFYDDLINGFITPSYVPLGIYDRFRNRFLKKIPIEKMRNPIDINLLFKIVENKKRLNVEAIKQKGIPFYIHLLNTTTLKSEFINARENSDMWKLLTSAVSAVPYYFPKNPKYIDGEIVDPFPLKEIREKYTDKKIVAVLNVVPHRLIRRFVKGILEGSVASLMYSNKIWSIFVKRDYNKTKLNKLNKEDKNLLIIYPDKKLKLWPNTTKREKLFAAYEAGQKAGQKIIDELK